VAGAVLEDEDGGVEQEGHAAFPVEVVEVWSVAVGVEAAGWR
jgi:hypothetical protein